MFRVHDAINSMASQWPNIHPKCGPFFDKCKPTSQYVHTRQGELPVTSSKHSPNIKRHYHFLSLFFLRCVCTKPTLVFFASYISTLHLCPLLLPLLLLSLMLCSPTQKWERKKHKIKCFCTTNPFTTEKSGFLFSTILSLSLLSINKTQTQT